MDSRKKDLGLTTWKNGPVGSIRETDVIIAKNYLNESELDQLNRIVTMYLDYAEFQAKNRVAMYMKDWIEKLDAFLQFNEKNILFDYGKVSNKVAEKLAIKEYKKYKIAKDRNYFSDFDNVVKKYLNYQKNEVKI